MATAESQILAEILAGVQKANDQLDKIDHTVYGNGQPGLTTRVAMLEAQASDAKAAAGNASDWKKQLVMTFLGGILGGGAILGGGKATGAIGPPAAAPPAATQPAR